MVDFQSRDTRRGPTDGDDDEAGADEPDDDTADAETTTDEPAAAADSVETEDEEAPVDAEDSDTPAASMEADTAAAPETSEAESSPAEVIDEAVSRAGDSEPAPEQEETGESAAATASIDSDPHPTADQSETEPPAASASDASTTDESTAATDDSPAATTPADTDARTRQVAVAVVTVGTATETGDLTGDAVESALGAVGHTVVAIERLRGDYDGIQQTVDRLVGRDDVEVVVTAGGIGVGPSAHTLEAVHPLFEKALPGFEEVYRSLLFEQQGTGVIRVRATAGIADQTPVFCLPADPAAATVAIDEIISAEAGPLVDDLA